MSATDLPDDAATFLDQMGGQFKLAMDAQHDLLDPDSQSHEFIFPGETKAEALGHAYHTRDLIQAAGRSCEATYVERHDLSFTDTPHHTIRIEIGAAEE